MIRIKRGILPNRVVVDPLVAGLQVVDSRECLQQRIRPPRGWTARAARFRVDDAHGLIRQLGRDAALQRLEELLASGLDDPADLHPEDLAMLSALAYYGAGLPLFAVVLGVQRWRGEPMDRAVIQAVCGVFSNTAMLGIPLVRLAFGEEGLAFLLTIIALHALTFLTLGTLLIELAGGSAPAVAARGGGLRPAPDRLPAM